MAKLYTPWGEADYVKHVMRGIRSVSTSGHGGVAVSKKLAETRLPKEALARAIVYGGYYWFEEDLEWRWPAICICNELASCSREELIKSTARVAVEYDMQNVYIAVCVKAGMYADVARENMRKYIRTEGVEKVRRHILEYADEFDATGKKGWEDYVHEPVYGVAKLFRENDIRSTSPREEIYAVGKALVESGAVGHVVNEFFAKYHYACDKTFLPVYLFVAA